MRELAIGILILSALSASGCKTTSSAVPTGEARQFRVKVETIGLAEPDQRLELFAMACAELASCAQECRPAFVAFGTQPKGVRGPAMRNGCFPFRKYSEDTDVDDLDERARDFVNLEIRRYAQRAANVLGPDGEKLVERTDRALLGQPGFFD